jgi:hypothetical protein
VLTEWRVVGKFVMVKSIYSIGGGGSLLGSRMDVGWGKAKQACFLQNNRRNRLESTKNDKNGGLDLGKKRAENDWSGGKPRADRREFTTAKPRTNNNPANGDVGAVGVGEILGWAAPASANSRTDREIGTVELGA